MGRGNPLVIENPLKRSSIMQEEIEIRKIIKGGSESLDLPLPKRFCTAMKMAAGDTVVLKLSFDEKTQKPVILVFNQIMLFEALNTKAVK